MLSYGFCIADNIYNDYPVFVEFQGQMAQMIRIDLPRKELETLEWHLQDASQQQGSCCKHAVKGQLDLID